MIGTKTIGMNRTSDSRHDEIGNSSANDAIDGIPMSVCSFSCAQYLKKSGSGRFCRLILEGEANGESLQP